ncbi:MAG: hypothetical protein K6E70_06980 [Butyrivibrio sp.]|nr:hypothetical protein [Butyrivibrio sp.]
MNNLLYTYEEVCVKIGEKGLLMYERADARDKFLWQFSKGGSTLHVDTVMNSRYVLYATEKDYSAIKRKAEAAGLDLALTERDKCIIEQLIAQYESVESRAILFIRNGNRFMQKEGVERKLAHVIVFFTNENLDFILDGLCTNDAYKEKKEEVKKVYVAMPKLPKLPALSDDDIKNTIPEGCVVSHQKYGQGIVKSVIEGRIKVLFEGSVEKIFAAQVCIDKNLLTVL